MAFCCQSQLTSVILMYFIIRKPKSLNYHITSLMMYLFVRVQDCNLPHFSGFACWRFVERLHEVCGLNLASNDS
jgi:hypothetical protein